MTIITSVHSGWGDLRAWLAHDTLDGRKVHTLFENWPNKDELVEAVLPYCLDQMRRHDRHVEPLKSAPYSPWFDALLKEAMHLEEGEAYDLALKRYKDCLRLKPDCIPAVVNTQRLEHRGCSFAQLLEQDWEGFGPYGDESWGRLKKGIQDIEDEEPDQFGTILENLNFDIEHQYTLYPSTLVLATFLLHHLAQAEEDRGQVTVCMKWLAHMTLYTMFPPYSVEDLEIGALWPVEKCWSFTDAYVLCHNEGARTTVDEAMLWFDHRQHAIWHQEPWEGYSEWQSCKVPCFAHAPFLQGGRNLIYDGICASIFQVIASGIPIYKRLSKQTPGQRFTDHVLWHVGHFAREDQDRIRQHVEPMHLEMFSHPYLYESSGV